MMEISKNKIYDKVAVIYPYLMRSIRYDKWAEYLYGIVKTSVNKNDLVLELGAGNGMLAENFRAYYPHIIITDLSFNMLRQGGIHGISTVCCDMTKIPFNSGFKLIFSAFDSVNYLTNRKKLLVFFKEVSRILAEGGLFTFDVSLERNSLKHVKEPHRIGKYKGTTFIQKSWYCPKSRIHKNTFELEYDNRKYVEKHKQKIYPFEEYFMLIEKAGLYVSECFEAFTFNNGNAECERVQFVVRK